MGTIIDFQKFQSFSGALQTNNSQLSSGPDATSIPYQMMCDDWKLIDTVLAGTKAMRNAGELYTPKFEYESDSGYTDRLKKTDLTNVLEDSVQNAVAKPFAQKLSLSNDANPNLQLWTEDVDLTGNDLHKYGEERFEHGISFGMSHTLVDYPDTSNMNLTKDDEIRHNIRPYLVPIDALDLLDIRKERLFGRDVVTYIRYKYHSSEYEGFAETAVVKIREIIGSRPYFDKTANEWKISESMWRVYKQDSSRAGWVVEGQGKFGLPYIPIETFYTAKRKGRDFVVKPPFLDLAYKNIVHWNSTSDQMNILTRSRFAMLKITGLRAPRDANGDIIRQKQGPDRLWWLEPPIDENGKPLEVFTQPDMSYIAAPTGGINEGWAHLKVTIEEMRLMGLDPLVSSNNSPVSATEKAMDELKSTSKLQNWAINFGHHMEACVGHMANWWNLDRTGIDVNIFTQFGIASGAMDELRFMQGLLLSGKMTEATFYEEVKRRHIMSPNFDPIQEVNNLPVNDVDF